jgi:hypothetical protein
MKRLVLLLNLWKQLLGSTKQGRQRYAPHRLSTACEYAKQPKHIALILLAPVNKTQDSYVAMDEDKDYQLHDVLEKKKTFS